MSRKARGFTMVETLIVLAVTAGLFVTAAIMLSGRQNQTQFDQAIREVQTQIQQVIEQVAAGFYPNSGNFTCTATATGPSFTNVSTGQGANSGCIFLGKAIQFNVSGGSADDQPFNVFSIAGLQRDSSGNEVTTYVAAKPEVIPSATETKKLLYGLSANSVSFTGGGSSSSTVAFVSSLATYNSGSLASGSQQVRLLPIKGSSLNQNTAAGIAAVNTYLKGNSGYTPDADVDPSSGVTICFASGTTNQSGLITIGGLNRQLSVTLSIKGNKTCS